jgi:hypothetical protein
MSIYICYWRQAFATGKPAAKAAPLAAASLAQPATPKGDIEKYMQ